MTRVPERLSIDKADRKLYEQCTISGEVLAGRANKEQFLFAMAIGFKNQVKRPLDAKDGFVRLVSMRPEDEALIDAVAIHDTGSADILSDREAVFRIAEEYAHAGIRLLYDSVTSGQPGSFHKKLEVELFDLFRNLDSA